MTLSRIQVSIGMFALMSGTALAQTTFTWTGGGGTTPWYDESNWDANGAPNQTDNGGSGNRLATEEENAVVVFDSETAVNGYMPTDTLQVSNDWFGSGASDHLMPALQLRNGILYLGNSNDEWWHYAGGNVYEIGDGDPATEARLVTSFRNWVRHRDRGGFVLITLNSDGVMEQTRNFDWGNNGDARMSLNGGTFVSAGAITGLATRENSFASFDAPGSIFTAPFGDGVDTDFVDIAAVNAAIGDSFINNTDEDLVVQDNQDGTFTITSGGTIPVINDLAITSIEVTGGVVAIEISGRDGVDYWCAGSGNLSTFENQSGLFSDSELTTGVTSPFQTTEGTVTLYLDAAGLTSRFFKVQNTNPGQ
jgi:hypothetical protein